MPSMMENYTQLVIVDINHSDYHCLYEAPATVVINPGDLVTMDDTEYLGTVVNSKTINPKLFHSDFDFILDCFRESKPLSRITGVVQPCLESEFFDFGGDE